VVNVSLNWINNVSCSFLSQVAYNFSLIKVDWLAAGVALRVVSAVLVVVLRHWRKICQSSIANEKQEPLPEEMFQTILTNKKKGLD
jgi:hypothetical protein